MEAETIQEKEPEEGVIEGLNENSSYPRQPPKRPAAVDPADLVYYFDINDLPLDAGDYTYFPDPNLNEPSWFEVIAWWTEFTSIHGVYYAFERGHFKRWKQVIWFVFTLACFAGMIATLTGLVLEFKRYDVTTSIEKINPVSLPFPQVTLCNTNMIDASRQNSTGILEPTNETELIAVSQPLEDFILLTRFNRRLLWDGLSENNKDMNASSIWKPIITSFGLCYTFETNAHVYRAGSDAGLQVYAWLGQDNYQLETMEAGIRVFVTQPNTTIISDQTAQTFVGPGDSAFLQMELTDYQREETEPWKQCSDVDDFTNEACRTECMYASIRNACGCRQIGDPYGDLPYCNSFDILPPSTAINDTNGEQASGPGVCSLLGEQDIGDCDCETPQCKEQRFQVQFSAAELSEKFASQTEASLNYSKGTLDANFVAVTINFGTIRYEKYQESPKTSINSLISDMGGQLGFFMGFSIISIVELVVELFGLRLLPRLFGRTQLYGFGQKQD